MERAQKLTWLFKVVVGKAARKESVSQLFMAEWSTPTPDTGFGDQLEASAVITKQE